MAEDTGVLLVALGIAGNLAVLVDILGEGGVVEHHAVFALQVFLAGVERLADHAVLGTDFSHRTPALRLDEDLGFFALVGADLTSVEVVGTQVPLAVPAVFLHSLNHGIDGLLHSCCLVGVL